jgi:hypothetical protein
MSSEKHQRNLRFARPAETIQDKALLFLGQSRVCRKEASLQLGEDIFSTSENARRSGRGENGTISLRSRWHCGKSLKLSLYLRDFDIDTG